MAVGCFAKFDKMPGPVSHNGSAGWVNVLFFRLGGEPGEYGKKPQAGKVSVQDFRLVKPLDRTSPLLLRACANGEQIPTVVLHACQKDSSVKYSFRDVMVSGISYDSLGGDSAEVKSESVSLSFTKVETTYEESVKKR